MKSSRKFLFLAVFLFVLVCLPVPWASSIRGTLYSFLRAPLGFSHGFSNWAVDLANFHRNAEEVRRFSRAADASRTGNFQSQEILLENERLTRLVGVRKILPQNLSRLTYARVIGRSDRILLIDKGTRDGIQNQLAVLSEASLVGKIVESETGISKVLLITDVNSKVAAILQRTRQQGVIFGTVSGECRMKYLSVDAEIKPGDLVETAGYSRFSPKGIPIGTVARVWKEPGQIYQVAQIRPLTDLSRLEEVACVEP